MTSRSVALRSGSAVLEIFRIDGAMSGRLGAALRARSACDDTLGAIAVGGMTQDGRELNVKTDGTSPRRVSAQDLL